MKKYGEILSIGDLKKVSITELNKKLNNFINSLDLEIGYGQKKSWEECIKYLKDTFKYTDKYDGINMVFEYWIPLSCYRRPDVIMFYKNKILVLEFKRKTISLEIDKNQLRGYLNELRNYHEITHSYKTPLSVQGCLVVTEAKDSIYYDNGIDIVEGNSLLDYLNKDYVNIEQMSRDEVNLWLNSKYMPLLDIIKATTNMFINGDIPQIKNIEEGLIKKTEKFILNSIKENKEEKRIIFLTGVPGSGKTLILLNIIYALNNLKKQDYIKALFTSGNGPLISTLSYILSKDKSILDGEAFIKEIKSIKSTLFNKFKNAVNKEEGMYQTILFDEAQRAWDLKHMEEYKFKISEPELLLKIQNEAFNYYGSSNLICSYGNGQSIYIGEESGFKVWSDVLNKKEYKDWNVFCSQEFIEYFKDRENTYLINDLSINTSIRGNFIDINPLINEVLKVDIKEASNALDKVYKYGFDIKITRDFNKITKYLKDYNKECLDKFYGLITSSNGSINTLKNTIPGFRRILSQKDNTRIGKWYVEDCNKLQEAAAEFGCQGLELNIPIVVFSRDYVIKDGMWTISDNVLNRVKSDPNYKKILKYKNKEEIFKNIYRVLLSRGRKGLLLFIPSRCSDLDETYEFFKNIGIKEID